MSSLPKKKVVLSSAIALHANAPRSILILHVHQELRTARRRYKPDQGSQQKLGTFCWNVASHRRYVFCMVSSTAGGCRSGSSKSNFRDSQMLPMRSPEASPSKTACSKRCHSIVRCCFKDHDV